MRHPAAAISERRNIGGFLKEESLEENYVSFIRVINDIDTQQPIGILLMNLNTSSIREAYTQVLKEYDTFFLMQDEKGEELYSTEAQGEDLWKLLEDQQRVGWQKMNTVTSQNERYGVIKLPLTDGWSETLALGYNQISNEYKIISYIEEHYRENITLDTLSKELYINKFTVSKIFSEQIGVNFRTYLGIIRSNIAAKLIRSTNDSLENISTMSGFSSVRTFDRTFYNNFRITPREYRKKLIIK